MSGPAPQLNNTIVRAGAGAGKTHGLVERVVEVFKSYRRTTDRSPRIVLTTFTRKATQELKERLILRACRDKDAELLQFVSDPAHLQISTIHGLLSVFLKQVGHLAGLDSGFQIVSEGEAAQLARLALRETLVEEASAMRWLELYGFDRVLQMCRRFETLQREQGELSAASLDDLETVAAEAGAEWARRLDLLIAEIEGGTDEKPWLNYALQLRDFTNSWRGRVPSKEGLPRKPSRRKERVDLEFLDDAVAEVIGKFRDEMDKPGWDESQWPAMALEWSGFQNLGQAFAKQLAAMKNQQSRFEMADLELKTLEILRSNSFLGSVFSESWDYWMIDEYQDTSPLQVEVLKALIGAQSKYLVGDPQQSIYLFRGAEVGVFRDAEREMASGGGEIIELTKNYRSQPELLEWINDFMQSISSEFVRMEPRAAVEATERESVLLWRAPDRDTELKGVAARIEDLLRQGARLEQICILGRTHRHLIEVSRVLKSYGYPTHVHAARGFGLRREVLDAQALWKFLLNPHDGLNLLLLLRSPWFNVEDWQLAEWMKDRPTSLWRSLANLDVPDAIVRLRECLANMEREGVVRAFENALTQNAFLDLSLNNDSAGRKESNLWKLIHRAQSLEREGGESLLALLQSEGEDPLEANEGDATSAQEPNSINLMTIHGAKGLEFDHVLVTAMGDSPQTSKTVPMSAQAGKFFFPVWQDEAGEVVSSLLDQQSVQRLRVRELNEFDRWLYVALTRAKQTLTLSWSGVGRESWASRSPWFLKKPGSQATASYTYSVVEEMPEPQHYASDSEKFSAVRVPFAIPSTAAPKPSARHSVTDLVEKENRIEGSGETLIHRWQAQNLGTRIHRALEALKYATSESELTNAESELSVSGSATDAADDEAVKFVLQSQDPPLHQLILNGETEWGFQVQTAGDRVVEGQIDLWAKQDGKLFVVDYKSGSAKFKEAAFRQLSLYIWALRKFGHTEPAEMLIVYPRTKKIERRAFTEDLFLRWESVLSVAETTG